MPRSDCPTNAEWAAFLQGDVAEADLLTLFQHLEACPLCEAATAALEASPDPLVAGLARAGRAGPAEAPLPSRLGGYDILGELGRGGMGVVYRAWDAGLARAVALKVLRGASLAGPEERRRFDAEGRAIARLQHPNIVQVFDTGEWTPPGGGPPVPYAVLELVEGGSLAARCAGRPQDPRQAARWLAALARAAHHAHEAGIVHRDIKPNNVLLTRAGEPKLCDFGIAKKLTDSTSGTGTGQLVGTLGYLAPEQVDRARGAIGPLTDVHALGILLHELLSGRLPFLGDGPAEMLRAVLEQPPPLTSAPGVPRALEAIRSKCLEKEPARRYASAADLADDLGRFLAGEPVRARLPGALERAARWARMRARAIAFTVAALALAGWLASRPTPKPPDPGPAPRPPQSLPDYLSLLSRAEKAWTLREPEEAARLLEECSPERRHWEWHHLRHKLAPSGIADTGHAGDVYAVCYSPDGARLATAGEDGAVRVLDTRTGEEMHAFKAGVPVRCLTFTADGVAAGGQDGAVTLWDIGTGKPRPLARHIQAVTALAVMSGGKALLSASADGAIRAWEMPSGKRGFVLPEPAVKGPVVIAAHPSAARLAVARGRRLTVWDTDTLKPSGPPADFPNDVTAMAYAPRGRLLVASNNSVWARDGGTGAEEGTAQGREHAARSLACSPDGQLVASAADDGEVRVWGIETALALGKPHLFSLRGAGPGRCVAFHPRGTQLAAAAGRTVQLWDTARREVTRLNTGRPHAILGRALGPGDRVLAVQAGDNAIGLFDLEAGAALPPCEGTLGFAREVVWSADGAWLAASGVNGGQLWEVKTRKIAWSLPARASHLTFDRVGRLLAFIGPDKRVTVREARTGAHVVTLGVRAADGYGLAFDGEGARLAESRGDKVVSVWEIPSGKEAYSLPPSPTTHSAVAFSPDGKFLATTAGRDVRLWDGRSGKALRTLLAEGLATVRLCFSPDGRRLAGGTADGLVRIWEPESGMTVLTLEGYGGAGPVVWGPAGRRIAAGEIAPGGVRVWDAPGFGASGR